MLPSTGHFKGLNCPFLESGLCERPYCHFKHARRDARLLRPTGPGPGSGSVSGSSLSVDAAPPEPKHTYNPTPIAELNRPTSETRRHIPVPYTPQCPYRPRNVIRRPHASTEGYVPSGAPNPSSATYEPGGAASSGATYSPAASAPITAPSLHYQPTPLSINRYSPTFSSDEEPASKKSKVDPKEEAVNFEGLESEFEILGQIIDDEKDAPTQPALADVKDKADTCKTRDTSHLKEKNHESSSSDRRKRDSKTEKQREKSSSKSEKPDSSWDRTKSKEKRDKSSSSVQSSSKSSHVKSKTHSDSDKSDQSKNSKDSKSKHSSDKNSIKKQSHKSDSNSKSKHNSLSKHSSDGDKRRKSESRSKSNSDRDRKSSKETPKPSKPKVVEETPVEFEEELIESFSESDEERIAEECLKIFEEYVPARKEHVNNSTATTKVNVAEDPQTGNKKRVAHAKSQPIHRQNSIVLPPDHKSRAVQLMADRYSKVKKFHEARIPPVPVVPVRHDSPVSISTSKIRIAHVPYVSNLLNAKKNLVKPPEVVKPTIVQTVTKGATRVAHIPNDKFCDRPGVLEPLASKIPVNIRTKYLNMMIDECLKIYLTVEDGYARAQQEELATSKKCSATLIYKNSGILAVNRLRKEGLEGNGVKKCGLNSGTNTISHDKILAGKIGEKASWSIENKYQKDNLFHDEFKGVKFYNNIARWVLSDQELRDNGFPRPHPESSEKGRAIIYTKNTRQKPQKGNIRWCCRCKKEYVVDKKGVAIVKEECIYHPNNKYRFRGEVKYQCCSQDGSSDGCLSAPCHVYEYVDHNDLRGFVKTLSKDDDFDDSIDHGIYALDCEMCYTTNGLDLTRVTVIDSSCKVVYESLVKPLYPIIDYNTRYSGLTQEIMGDCTTTLLEVQATFLHMFSNKTILVGHSLESDFKALKLIHDTIVDTSVLFPHKMGPPYKRALRNLTSEYLKKIIQNSVDGHDSAEDALVCMELLIWKLKEELKTR
ncbi:RNA exonuclease 1 homolog [Arctopsyche grandis]|uniref:RNA exonuclease 1 homolog n=1 Tax=Arctopsyche grandis TaxID=121162 RepID=UPI00406D7459